MILAFMETRLQRYAKYRASIRLLPEDAFSDDGKFNKTMTSSELKSLASMGRPASVIHTAASGKPEIDIAPEEGQVTPYAFYLAKKKAWWVAKAIISMVVLGGLVAFFAFFVGF